MNLPSLRMMIATHSLTKRYGDVTALDGCSLEVERGEVFGLLGPNGSGKTTLIRLWLGYLQPTAGWARVDGFDCYRDALEVHRRAAYLPGEARLFPRMTGREALQFFAEVRPDGDWALSCELARRLDLDLNRRVAHSSTGMRQKLALAATLATRTPLVILDEPTANLDPTVRGEVLTLVREARQAGRTVVFSSHVLSEVEAACDRVVILSRGRLMHTQVMGKLRRQHRIRAELTGALPPIPPAVADGLTLREDGHGMLEIDTPGELSPLLGWLATLPIREVRVEPIGLRAVYDRYHGRGEDE